MPPRTFISKLLLEASAPPIAVFALHILRLIILPEAYQLDMIAHFLGGASIAWSAFILYRFLSERKLLPKLPPWFLWFTCVTSAELVGVLWEFQEYIVMIMHKPDFGLTLSDTLGDLSLDLAGACIWAIVLVITTKNKRQKQPSTQSKSKR